MDAISRRDYLAAHAPTEPQAWFKPLLPAAPSEPEAYPEQSVLGAALKADQNDEIESDYFGWRCIDDVQHTLGEWRETGGRYYLDEALVLLKPWCDEWRKYWELKEAHEVLSEKALLVQWPWAWADAVIAAEGVKNEV